MNRGKGIKIGVKFIVTGQFCLGCRRGILIDDSRRIFGWQLYGCLFCGFFGVDLGTNIMTVLCRVTRPVQVVADLALRPFDSLNPFDHPPHDQIVGVECPLYGIKSGNLIISS